MENVNQTTIRSMLEEEYLRTIDDVKNAESETEEAVWKLKKLDALGKQYQLMSETITNDDYREKELDMKRKSEKSNHCFNWANLALTTLLGAVGTAITSYWYSESLSFEEKGVHTSKTPQFVNNLSRLFKK